MMANYSTATPAVAAYRKSKVNGTDNNWPEANYTVEHTIYLKLPHKLQQGKHYTLGIAPGVNTDTTSREFTFDIFSSVSEAIHVNLIGYNPDHTAVKSADLYMWLGDGGARDYSSYAGRKVILYNVGNGQKQDAGTVTFWKKSGSDFGNWNLTRSDVWNCDFSSFTRYRHVPPGDRGRRLQPGLQDQPRRLLRALQDLGPRLLLYADRGQQGHHPGAAAAALHPRRRIRSTSTST